MGFSNDDDPYGAMFAAADEEQRQKAAASDKEWAARGVVKVAPEPEEPEEPAEPEIKVNWPSYIREDVRELWKEAGILPEENALIGEDFGWELESEAPAHTEAGQKRREDEKGPVMEAMVDSLKFFGAKSTKSREIRKELRGLNRDAGRQLGTLLKAIHLFEEDEAGFSHMRAARLRTNLITREGIPLILEGLHPVYRSRGVQVGMLKELDLAENSLGGVGVARLCDGLIRLRYIGLERLDLSGNHSHIEGARALARLISSEAGCTINMLQTRRNNHFDAGIKCFGKVSFGRLEFLDIRENFFTARGAAELANGFRDNETLTALDFRGTVLALEGLWAMGNALKRRKKRFREIQLRLGDKFSRAPIKDKWQALAERDGWTEEEIKYAHDAPSNPQREGETLEAWHERRDAQMGLDHRVLGDDPGPRRREDLGEVGSKYKHAPYEYDVFFFGEPVKARSLFQKCFGHHIIGSLDITCCPTCYAIPMLWREYGTTACSVIQDRYERERGLLKPNAERLGRLHISIITAQTNIVRCYDRIGGRDEEALAVRRKIYAEHQSLYGPAHAATLLDAVNLATSLSNTKRYAEGLSLVREILPLMQRALTRQQVSQNQMRTFQLVYARGLYQAYANDIGTLDDLIEAEAMLSDVAESSLRVLGAAKAHETLFAYGLLLEVRTRLKRARGDSADVKLPPGVAAKLGKLRP